MKIFSNSKWKSLTFPCYVATIYAFGKMSHKVMFYHQTIIYLQQFSLYENNENTALKLIR